jgi:Zn-dependent peptidase ImmA (M78 family)
MKTQILLFCALLFSITLNGKNVSEQQAKIVASNFLLQNSKFKIVPAADLFLLYSYKGEKVKDGTSNELSNLIYGY